MRKNSEGFIQIIVVILLLIVVAGGAYYFGTQKGSISLNLKPTSAPVASTQPIVTPSPSGTLVQEGTANWKTFTSSVYSFKYPTTWDTYMIGGTGGTLMVAPKEIVDGVRKMTGGFGGGKFLTMTINSRPEAPIWKTDEFWQVKSQAIVVGGIGGTKHDINVIQDTPGLSKGDETTSIVIQNNNAYISIDFLDLKYKEIFDQILSTFKFSK